MSRKDTLRQLIAIFAASVPVALAAMPPAEAWQIGPWVRGRNYSVGMPPHPSPVASGGVAMIFPVAGHGQVDALTTTVGSLARARQITMRYRVDAAPGTRFVADEAPNEPATVSIYFQQAGDDWSARGRYASYRWYVPARAVIPLTPGVRSVTVRFDETWTNVNGQPNTSDPAGYATALANASQLGIAFGSRGLRSHGVYTTGQARFTLLSLDIR